MREHDQEAVSSLVEFLYPTVIRIVRNNLPRRADPEDLAQDIFLRMFEKLDHHKGEAPLEHWVPRIATNHCLNALRSQKARPERRMADLSEEQAEALGAATTTAVEEPHPAHLMGARELVNLLLESLSPKDRMLVRTLELEERSISEVSELTG